MKYQKKCDLSCSLATVIFSCVKIWYYEFICDFARGGYVLKKWVPTTHS